MADIVIKQIEEGMTGRQVADLLYSNFLALLGAIGSGGGGDIPTADIEKGVTAYGWGDHRQAGYLKGITGGMVTGALGYTPLDEAAWTKANIKATLGIADWALAASKPTYTTKEVAEDGNLYFTDARAVAALAGVTDALAGDIGVLQGYFTNGVAKSAAKLQTARKLWGQLFNGEADVTGALTGVTDITASGTLTIGKIKIGDGVIEWDAVNGGFKVTGGLWATDYLSSKGVNTGASGGGGGGSSYQRLDTWDGYTTAKDGWVLSAKLGYGLKTTQDDILRQLANITGQGTNVTFTPSLTSGTQIGTLTIDGEPVKMYAPSIPTTDIDKGVTAYGWGNHASVGYAMASALGGYLPLSGGTITGLLTINGSSTYNNRATIHLVSNGNYPNDLYFGSNSTLHWSLSSRDSNDKYYFGLYNAITSNWVFIANSETNIIDYQYLPTYIGNKFIHEGNYTDYVYSKTTIDSKLGGYLPLSGGTITSSNFDGFIIKRNSSSAGAFVTYENNNGRLGLIGFENSTNEPIVYHGSTTNKYDYFIHSGNIGSQSVASATKLATSRKLWGQSFNGENDVNGHLSIGTIMAPVYANRAELSIVSETDVPCDLWLGNSAGFVWSINCRPSTENRSFSIYHGSLGHLFRIDGASGDVGIGTTNPQYKLDVNGTGKFDGLLNINIGNSISSVAASVAMELHRTNADTDASGVNIALLAYQNKGILFGGGGFGGSFHYRNGYTNTEIMRLSSNGNVGINTTSPQYKLDVVGTLHASSTVTFDGALKVGGVTSIGAVQAQYDANRAQLSVISTANMPAMLWLGSSGEKKWSVESRGEADSYRFSLYSWVSSKHILKIEHSGVATLDGTFNATTGIWSDGYVSAKGQNTSSDMRLKRVLEEVTLSVDEIAAAPAVRFAWKGGAGVDVGTSAQYWEKVLPDVVKRDDAGWLTMQYGNAAMVAVIALARRVQELEKQLEQLTIKN